MTKKHILKIVYLGLFILMLFISIFIIQIIKKVEFVSSNEVRLKIIRTVFLSKIKPFWYNQFYEDQQWLDTQNIDNRTDYFAGTLYVLSNKLEKSGEANLFLYDVILPKDRSCLYQKLEKLETTNFYQKIDKTGRDYIHEVKENLVLLSKDEDPKFKCAVN